MHGDLIKSGYVNGHYTFWQKIATKFWSKVELNNWSESPKPSIHQGLDPFQQMWAPSQRARSTNKTKESE